MLHTRLSPEVIRQSADEMENRGWIPYTREEPGSGRVCALGAINFAMGTDACGGPAFTQGIDDIFDKELMDQVDRLANLVGAPRGDHPLARIADWSNDHKDRGEGVVRDLRHAADVWQREDYALAE